MVESFWSDFVASKGINIETVPSLHACLIANFKAGGSGTNTSLGNVPSHLITVGMLQQILDILSEQSKSLSPKLLFDATIQIADVCLAYSDNASTS